MDFNKLAEDRYSVRKFIDEPVDRETLAKILHAGRIAPTACNNQPQRILVIDSEDALTRLRRCTSCHFGAKAALLVCSDVSECWKREFDGKSSGDVDAAIVTTQMMLAAADLGIGSTWVMYFKPDAMREEFAIPENYEPIALLVLGHPAPDAKPHRNHADKKAPEETIFYNKF